jgi:hypothetical protein
MLASLSGTVVKSYQVGELLGEGGFAQSFFDSVYDWSFPPYSYCAANFSPLSYFLTNWVSIFGNEIGGFVNTIMNTTVNVVVKDLANESGACGWQPS